MNSRQSLHARPGVQHGADFLTAVPGEAQAAPATFLSRLNLHARPAAQPGADFLTAVPGVLKDTPGSFQSRLNLHARPAAQPGADFSTAVLGVLRDAPAPFHGRLSGLSPHAHPGIQPGEINKPNSGEESAKAVGLYVHVPFCAGKCPYCDFYSIRADESRMDAYAERMIREIEKTGGACGRRADSLYFGGGTPSLLGAERLCRILEAAQKHFGLENAEITVEANPESCSAGFLRQIHSAGINRLSLGLQSADETELRLLGRRHTAEQAAQAVSDAFAAGFENISLDLMLAVQGQTAESLSRSIAFCARAGVQHISAYLLTLEPGTAYAKNRAELRLPEEDAAAALYLQACEELEQAGYAQYEISNFARPGFESRHNLKYWRCEEYLGFGPAAHSFFTGKRFHAPRSIGAFLRGEPPEQDGPGGGFEEYAMLGMRLAEGLSDGACRTRFGHALPQAMKDRAKRFEPAGLTHCRADGFRFTPRGFLLSDALTPEILFPW